MKIVDKTFLKKIELTIWWFRGRLKGLVIGRFQIRDPFLPFNPIDTDPNSEVL